VLCVTAEVLFRGVVCNWARVGFDVRSEWGVEIGVWRCSITLGVQGVDWRCWRCLVHGCWAC
jgi:hypothetical protein